MDLRKRRKHSVEKLPVGSVRTRQNKRPDGTRFKVRVIKISQRGRGDQKWIGYARWLWERAHGPVPKGNRVLHRDGNTMNDDLSNLILGTAADVVYLFCHADPAKSEENRRRCSAATSDFNRERAEVRRLTEILPSQWYAVDLLAKSIFNEPRRSRHLLMGIPCVNGRGWLGWALGWPDHTDLHATILASLAGSGSLALPEILQASDAILTKYGLRSPQTLRAFYCALSGLAKAGDVGRIVRGTYCISDQALGTRKTPWPYVPVRGFELLENPAYAGFNLASPNLAASSQKAMVDGITD